MSIRHGGHPLRRPLFFTFATEGMCVGKNNIRRPGDRRERAEGERPGPGRKTAMGSRVPA